MARPQRGSKFRWISSRGSAPGKRPAVRVTINGHTYRSTLAPRGGKFLLPVSAEQREKAGVSAGDKVEVDIEVDNQPREVTVPPDFAEALDRDADARRFFDGLSFSKKQWHVLSIEGAKTAETRQRRIDKSVTMLSEGRALRSQNDASSGRRRSPQSLVVRPTLRPLPRLLLCTARSFRRCSDAARRSCFR